MVKKYYSLGINETTDFTLKSQPIKKKTKDIVDIIQIKNHALKGLHQENINTCCSLGEIFSNYISDKISNPEI